MPFFFHIIEIFQVPFMVIYDVTKYHINVIYVAMKLLIMNR